MVVSAKRSNAARPCQPGGDKCLVWKHTKVGNTRFATMLTAVLFVQFCVSRPLPYLRGE